MSIVQIESELIEQHHIQNYVYKLYNEEEFEPIEGAWLFSGGGCCGRCTDAALRIALEFHGCVMGYFSSNNPTAVIGNGLCAGHDFAFINERFIVDYWAFRVGQLIDRPILDLCSLADRKLVRQLYGEKERWEIVPIDNVNILNKSAT